MSRALTPPAPDATEHEHQRWLVKLFRQAMPHETLFAIPNGGQRSRTTAARLKAEGVLAGVWDLMWLQESMWIEMKTPSGRLSPNQIAFGEAAEASGYRLIVGYGWEDAWSQIQHGERCWREKPKK